MTFSLSDINLDFNNIHDAYEYNKAAIKEQNNVKKLELKLTS